MKFTVFVLFAFVAAVVASPLDQAIQRECREEHGHECHDDRFRHKCEHLGEDRITCCRDHC